MKMAVSIQISIASVAGFQASNPEEALFSDKIFFEVHQDFKSSRSLSFRNEKDIFRYNFLSSNWRVLVPI